MLTQKEAILKDWVQDAWKHVTEKIDRTSERIGATFPHASLNGTYNSEPPSRWTAGFWPGILWLIYRETGSDKLRAIAEECEQKLDTVLNNFSTISHDAGFMWSLSSVAQYKLVENERSKQRALKAANILAGRFNLKGQYIRAWNDRTDAFRDNIGWAIIDCMMNLPLLYWASEETLDPRFRHIAMAHADMVLREFIRPDGSVYHIVVFDPETGERIGSKGGQGYAPESAWSRGTTWALYGMALSYRYTKEVRYLDAAKKVAHYFLANLPEDTVPNWDFRLPEPDNAPKDSTAAAIAASGLIEISQYLQPTEAKLYFESALKIVKSLDTNYGAWDAKEEGLLLHGTSNLPQGTYIDVPIIYGDYFFIEALAKLKGRNELFW